MLDEATYSLIMTGLRTAFLTALPIIVVLGLAGTLAGVFQAATNVREESISYLVKILALSAALYFFLPGIIQSLIDLAQQAWGP